MSENTAPRNAPLWVTILLALAGVALVVIGVLYFTDTAAKLPSFFPGHETGSAHHHTKHGIVAVIVGVAAFVAAWISTGRKRPSTS